MAVSVPVTSPRMVSLLHLPHNPTTGSKIVYYYDNIILLSIGSLLVSSGYDMQVNVWNMNNYQLKNSYKVILLSILVIIAMHDYCFIYKGT